MPFFKVRDLMINVLDGRLKLPTRWGYAVYDRPAYTNQLWFCQPGHARREIVATFRACRSDGRQW